MANVQDGHVNIETIKTIAVERSQVTRFELKAGDVLMTEGGDFDKLGRGTVWRGEIPGCLHQNHVFAVRTDPEELLPDYLAAWTSSSIGRRYFREKSKQTTNLASINSLQVKAAPLLLPSLDEQHAIAELLSVMDSHVYQVAALLRAKRRLKRALRHKLLTGLLGFPSAGGNPPWTLIPLGDISESVTRRNRKRVVRALTCSGARGLIDQRDYFSKTIAGEMREGYVLLERGEFAYNRSTMAGYPYGAIKRLDAYEEGALSTLNICFALTGNSWVSDFAVHVFESGLLNPQLARVAKVGARAHGLLNITHTDLARVRVPVPSIEEQNRISHILSALDHEINLLERLAASVDRQKLALLNKLLSGEVRLPTT